MSVHRATSVAAVASTVALVVAACSSSSGKHAKSAPSLAPAQSVAHLTLTSPAFADQSPIPPQFTCAGANQSPPLAWSGVPPNATELRLTVVDPDAPGGSFMHWALTRIDPHVTSIGAGQTPPGAVGSRNSRGEDRYTGPCPPAGKPHHYVFTLQALNGDVLVGEGTLTGTFSR